MNTIKGKLTAVGLCGALALWTFGVPRLLEETETILVTKTFVKNDRYLVYGIDEKGKKVTYEVSDTLAYFRYTSSDFWGGIESGTSYEITHTGFRLGLLSWYENIVVADKV